VDDAILANAAFLNQIVANTEIFENGGRSESEEDGDDLGENLGETLAAHPQAGDGEGSSTPRSHPHHPHPHGHSHEHTHSRSRRPREFDIDKVRSTLKQLVRDWSEEVRMTSSLL
jgi:carnosine N-methyltransferase